MRIREVPFYQGRHWTPVKLSPNGEGHARFYRVTNSEVANCCDSVAERMILNFLLICDSKRVTCLSRNGIFPLKNARMKDTAATLK